MTDINNQPTTGESDKLCYITMKGHQFVVPVEWVELTQALTRRPYGHKVTILRCACGKEQKR